MSLKAILAKKNLKYLFLGGKGGVGKTICASAISIELAKHFERVIVVSTDPAHSLSDCFDQDLSGGEPVLIEGVKGTLYGMELEAEKGYESFKELSSMGMDGATAGFPGMPGFTPSSTDDPTTGEQQEGAPPPGAFNFQEAMGLGTDLLSSDTIPPGSDEAFAFGKMLELVESSEFDVVIFDTAPTGHTLRLLSLPDYLDSFVGKMLKMRMRFGNLFKSLKGFFGGGTGGDSEENSIQMLESLKKTITKARIELADDQRTEFIPVTIPTLMALYETERLINSLIDYSIPVEHLIVNQLMPPNKKCQFCAKRFDIQEKTMLTLKQYFDKYDFVEVPMVPQEIRGIEQLETLAKILFN